MCKCPEFRNWLEPKVLSIIAIAAGALWVFLEIAEDIIQGEKMSLDVAILMALRSPTNPLAPFGPPWFQELARDITALGSTGVLVLVVITALGFLVLSDNRRTAAFLLASTSGGAVLSMLLKHYIGRPRPDLVPHATQVFSASFPSGHAMLATVVYLTIAALLARLLPTKALQLYLMAIAVTLSVLIGISRIYLGVHWPSDVLGGWAAGASWALACWLVAWFYQLRNKEAP
jgi:undecaprenyl-diphosphatase